MMMKIALLLFLAPTFLMAQGVEMTFDESIEKHREVYKENFLKNARSPLKLDELGNLRFFQPDENYKVKCTLELTPDEKPFDLPTYSGETKPYRKYGTLHFELKGRSHSLAVYQSIRHIRLPHYKNHLFLPYRDYTNGETTYGGGRYIDLKISDVKSDVAYIDFNKSYNPWCGYADGYSCPIPPKENHLEIAILAGEKMYAGKHE